MQFLVTSVATYNDNNWHFCAFTWDSSVGQILYIDNAAGVTGSYTTTGSTNATLQLGRNYNGGGTTWYFAGSLDEVGVWSRALTSAEILQNFNDTKTRFGF